jgi:hypothetical protein
MRLFNQRNRDEEFEDTTAEREPPRRSFVPASALPPERNRLGIFDSSEEADREDIDFLTAIARQAERTATTPPSRLRPQDVRHDVPADDRGLDVFREFAPVFERSQVLQTVRVPDVELGDLLDELATTAAALRLRRAA